MCLALGNSKENKKDNPNKTKPMNDLLLTVQKEWGQGHYYISSTLIELFISFSSPHLGG